MKTHVKIGLLALCGLLTACPAPEPGGGGGTVVIDSGTGDDAGNVITDRVKLKPSPRGIITWRGDMPRDTSADFWDYGKVKARLDGDHLKVFFIKTGAEALMMEEIVSAGTDAQLAVYGYAFKDGELPDQLVVFYSPDDSRIRCKVFNVGNAPPFISEVPFEDPEINNFSPIPGFDMHCDMLKVYDDANYHHRIKQFAYTNSGMQSR